MKVLLFMMALMLGISACNKADIDRAPQSQEEQTKYKQYKDLSEKDVQLRRDNN